MATVADEWRDELVAAARKAGAEWSSRLEESAQAIIELLGNGITHTRNAAVAPSEDKTTAVESLKSTFRQDLCRLEEETHLKLGNLFGIGGWSSKQSSSCQSETIFSRGKPGSSSGCRGKCC
jgi:hypothetical protein